jgi:hypothetical protein
VIGLIHVALIAPRYHVGSFDDDASYILAAKALLAGQGLTGHLASGEVVVGLYPPGYSALLAPLVWLWPHSFAPLRLLSTVCFAAVFPLLWIYLGRHRVSPAVRTAALTVLALGPPFATYATMVMAEGPFLVAFVMLLLAVDRWALDARAVSWSAAAVIGLAATVVWFKQAGVGVVFGLLLWLPFSRTARRWAKTALLFAGVVAALAPVVATRLASGIPIAGARYSQELGGFYQGGLLKRLADVVPASTWHLLSTAIPATIVPYLEPLPIGGAWPDLWKVVSWQVTILIVVGAVVWVRRHRDAAVPMTVVYLAESVLWPFVNERRAILVLPLLVSWYVIGAVRTWEVVRARAAAASRMALARRTAVTLAVLLVVAPLVAQAPRDYLYGWGQSSSQFGGSRYAAVLRQLGSPTDVVETDYRSSTALFTGHVTNWNAFIHALGGICYEPGVLAEMESDHAAFLLLGDVNKPGVVDNACIQSQAMLATWAVQILHTDRDNASVYELIGPSTAHPDLVNVLSGATPAVYGSSGAQTSVTWSLPGPTPISQLSVGQAAPDTGSATGVRLEVERLDHTWVAVAAARSAVGDGAGRAPYLLSRLGTTVPALAVRVVVDGVAPGAGVTVTDVAVLGPGSA